MIYTLIHTPTANRPRMPVAPRMLTLRLRQPRDLLWPIDNSLLFHLFYNVGGKIA